MLTFNLVFAYFIITLGASFQFGFQTGVMNAVFKTLESFINETNRIRGNNYTTEFNLSMSSLIVAAFPVGGMIGAILGAYFSNKFGRKTTLFIFSVPTLIGSILMASAKAINSYEAVIVGRMVIGVSCGAYTGIAPMMLAEFSPVAIRGASGIVNQLVIVLALLFAQILGIPQALGNAERWPYLLGFSLLPCLIQLVILPFCPESPRYLMINKRNPMAAKQALRWLRGIDYTGIEVEINDMESEITSSLSSHRSDSEVKDIFTLGYLRLALFIAIICHMSQQLSGINAVLNYSTILFTSAGVSQENAVYATLGTGIVNLLVTLVSIFLVDRYGRRTLHLTGLGGMLGSGFLIFFCLLCKHWSFNMVYFAIIGVYLFVSFFAIGPGSIPWFIVPEIFCQDYRDVALAISVLVNWVSQIFVVMLYPLTLRYLQDYSFIPFIVLLALFFGLLFRYMPETKNRSATSMEQQFRHYTGEQYEHFSNQETTSIVANKDSQLIESVEQ